MSTIKYRKDITSKTGIRSTRKAENYKSVGLTNIDLTTRVDLTDDEREKERQRLLEVFPQNPQPTHTNPKKSNMVSKVKDRIQTLTTLNQSHDGACTVAALFNLLHLEGKDSYHPEIEVKVKVEGKKKKVVVMKQMTWDQIRELTKPNRYGEQHGKYFHRKVYQKLMKQFETYGKHRVGTDAICIGESLKAGMEIKLPVIMKTVGDPLFKYIPITSEVNGSTYLNREIVGDDEREIYNKLSKYIENLIDDNTPVAISQNGHARVIVGYNKKSVLFVDSWGDNFSISNADSDDSFKAGFSTMDKWQVYSSLRDLAYFEPKKSTKPTESKKSTGYSDLDFTKLCFKF